MGGARRIHMRELGSLSRLFEEKWGDLRVELLEPPDVFRLQAAYADLIPLNLADRTKPVEEYANRPAAANNLLRCLSAVLSWSVPRGCRKDNPCDKVELLKGSEPYEPWSWREIAFWKKHARKELWYAAAPALYTGQRQGDVLAMRRSHIRGNEIRVKQEKTDARLWIQIHRDLRTTLDEMPKTSLFLLTNSRGTAWTQDGFRASWQSEVNSRPFRVLRKRRKVFHELRKSASCFCSRPAAAMWRSPPLPDSRVRWSSTMRSRSISVVWPGPQS